MKNSPSYSQALHSLSVGPQAWALIWNNPTPTHPPAHRCPVWHLHLGLKAVPDYSCPLLSSTVQVPPCPVPPQGLPLRTTLAWAATPSLLPQYCRSPLPWTHVRCNWNSHLATMKWHEGGQRPHIWGKGRRNPAYSCTMEPLLTLTANSEHLAVKKKNT